MAGGIVLTSGFDRSVPVPLDLASVVANTTARDAIPSGIRYQGMLVYSIADATNFQLVGGITNSDWTELSGGGASGELLPNGTAESGTTGWTEGSFAGGPRPTGAFTSGSIPGTFNISTTATAPLTGKQSFVLTKSSGVQEALCVLSEFDLALGDRAKVLTIDIQSIILSGTFTVGTPTTDSSLIWYCQFFDGSSWTAAEPSSFKVLANSTTTSDVLSSTIQTPYNATKMRLIAFIPDSSANAWAMKCEMSVKRSSYVYGTPITEWESWTPTGAWANTTYTGFSRRVGGNLEFMAFLTLTGTPSGTLSLNLPSGLSLDSSKLSPFGMVGSAYLVDATPTTGRIMGAIVVDTATSLTAVYVASQGGVAPTIPFTWASGDNIRITASVPILGWSSSVQMSDNAATRIVSCILSGSTTSLNNAGATIAPTTVVVDTHGAFSGSTYTIPASGLYIIQGGVTGPNAAYTAGDAVSVWYAKNGGGSNRIDTVTVTVTATRQYRASGVLVAEFKAGDTIVFIGTSTVTGNAAGFDASITRVSGPSSIAATEIVACSYGSTAGGTIGTADTLQSFATSLFDTHGSWNGSVFTAPVAGIYEVACELTSAAVSITIAQTFNMFLYKNGAAFRELAMIRGNGSSLSRSIGGSSLVKLSAGETVSIYAACSVATTQITTGGRCYIDIKRLSGAS